MEREQLKQRIDIRNTDIIVLAGGLGTRLSSVIGPTTPKFLAPFGAKPFAETFLEDLEHVGFKSVILALGLNYPVICDYIQDFYDGSLRIMFAIEDPPKGIESAINLTAKIVESDPVFVCNGDTLLDVDFELMLKAFVATPLVAFHGDSTSGLYLLPKRYLTRPHPLGYAVGFPCGPFYDVGTPEGYERAKNARGIV